jgi:phage head maturation protease
MAPTTDAHRAVRPPLASVREAPFALRAAGDGEPNDGLTLDGYGAVFNNLTTIDSWEGRFREQIAPGSMKRSFRETPPKIQFDHGRHPMIGSIPIAELRSISEDTDPVLAPAGGAHIIGRVFDNWLMAPVRDAIAAGAINGMSFRFSVVPGRESWTYADGTPIKDERSLMTELDRCMYGDVPDEELPIRTLKELKVPEVGPVTWPAYESTSVSMRSKVIDLGRLVDPAQRKLLAEAVFIADRAESDPQRAAAPMDADDDPAALASALDAVLDEAAELIAGVDLSTLPPEVAQACALITAAELSADALLEAMGIYDPDDDESSEPTGRSKDVDTQQPTSKVGTRLSAKDDTHLAELDTELGKFGLRASDPDAQQDTDLVVKRPSQGRNTDAQRSTSFVGERPSQPRRFTDKQLRMRNQRDRLLNLRALGDRPL